MVRKAHVLSRVHYLTRLYLLGYIRYHVNHHEREIRIYQTREGRFPFSEWFEHLRDQKTQQVVDSRLARVRLGNLGDAASLGGGLYELRIHFGPGFRIYFGMVGHTSRASPLWRRQVQPEP